MSFSNSFTSNSFHLQRKLPASHPGPGRLNVSLVPSKSLELTKDDMQLVARSSYHHHEELDGKEEEKQLIQCSDCKDFETGCVFVLLITWDGVLMVLVASHVDFINFPPSCRFSVLWIMLVLPLQSCNTIQGCPQSGLQVW